MSERLTTKIPLVQKWGLFFLGLICLLYSTLFRDFAELNIQLPGLNFPIFVGEIFFGIYLLVLLSQARRFFVPLKLWHIAFFLYGVWILDNALRGYLTYGPLAFRNAALFYYSFFAVIGFFLYRQEVFSQRVVIFILSVLLAAKLIVGINNFYIYPCLILSIILFLKIENRWVRLLFLIPLIYIPVRNLNAQTHFFGGFFFIGARARVIGHILAFLFLSVVFALTFSKFKNKRRWVIFSGAVFLIAVSIFQFADPTTLKSLTHFDELSRMYHETEEIIRERGYYKAEIPEVRLYTREDWDIGKVLSWRMAQTVPSFKKDDKEKIKAVKALVVEMVREQQATIKKNALAIKQEKEKELAQLELQETSVPSPENPVDPIMPKPKVSMNSKKDVIEPPQVFQQGDIQTKITEIEKEKDFALDEMVGIEQGKTYDQAKALIQSYNLETEITVEETLRTAIIPPSRDLGGAINTILFRFYIWKDMLTELYRQKAIWGMNWGWPQRSKSIETLGWASMEWGKDGWITPHNSFLHFIYRGGIIGALLIVVLGSVLIFFIVDFIKMKSAVGILLMSIFIYWVTVASFSVFLEFPYSAIPFWGLLGLTIGYHQSLTQTKVRS